MDGMLSQSAKACSSNSFSSRIESVTDLGESAQHISYKEMCKTQQHNIMKKRKYIINTKLIIISQTQI